MTISFIPSVEPMPIAPIPASKSNFSVLTVLIIALALASFFGCTSFSRSISVNTPPMLGAPGARTEVILFSDFQCYYCARMAEVLQRLHRSYPNRFKVYFLHFPLTIHPFSESAARAAEAAREQGKFREMHDLLFRHRKILSQALIIELAEYLQLDIIAFRIDYESAVIAERVQTDLETGRRLGVSKTPTVFINRMPFHGSLMDLERQIR